MRNGMEFSLQAAGLTMSGRRSRPSALKAEPHTVFSKEMENEDSDRR